jgi:hypothetical protein
MTALLIGYARCSTDEQDLTVQREGLAALGVTPDRIYVHHGLTAPGGGRGNRRPSFGVGRPQVFGTTVAPSLRRRQDSLAHDLTDGLSRPTGAPLHQLPAGDPSGTTTIMNEEVTLIEPPACRLGFLDRRCTHPMAVLPATMTSQAEPEGIHSHSGT